MHTSIALPVTRAASPKTITRSLIVKLVAVYLVVWITVYLDSSTPIRYLVGAVLIIYQFTSFHNAAIVMLFVLFLPFAGELLGMEYSGIEMNRLAFLPFLLQAFLAPKLRTIKFDNTELFLIVFSVLIILGSAFVRQYVQEIPLSSGRTEAFGPKMMAAQTFDNTTPLIFLYYVFTRIRLPHLNQLFDILILLAALEALSIMHVVSENPSLIFASGPVDVYDKSMLWKSVFFGHKNNWGLVMVIMFFGTLARKLKQQDNAAFYNTAMVLLLIGAALSLSRQAYLTLCYGFILIAFWKRDFKIVFIMTIVTSSLLIIQPEFLFNRMESLASVSSTEELQQLNTKMGDNAIGQFKENFSIIPQMFLKEWEYNWSEGFWNGMLHQLGILGLVMILTIYFLLFKRFVRLKRISKFNIYGILGMLIIIIMCISNFNRRVTNFCHYNGKMDQIGFTILFIFFYLELIYFLVVKKVPYVSKM